MELASVKSIFGSLGESFLGSGAYQLLKPVLGKFSLVPIPLAKAAYNGVSQLFNKVDSQKVKDEAFIGFFDGVSQALDFAMGQGSLLSCAVAGGVGSFFSEGARAYSQNHNVQGALEVGAKALLFGVGLAGLFSTVLHFKTGKPLADELIQPPSVLSREVQSLLPGLVDRVEAHKSFFLKQGGSEDLFQRLFSNVGYIGRRRFNEGIRDIARVIDESAAGESFSIGYHGEGSRSGRWVAERIKRLLNHQPTTTFSSDDVLRPYVDLISDKSVFIVDDALYSGFQAGSLAYKMVTKKGVSPDKITVVTVGMSRAGLNTLLVEGVTSAFAKYGILGSKDVFEIGELYKLAQIYGYPRGQLPISISDSYLASFHHKVSDYILPPLDVSSDLGAQIGIFDPSHHRYPRNVKV